MGSCLIEKVEMELRTSPQSAQLLSAQKRITKDGPISAAPEMPSAAGGFGSGGIAELEPGNEKRITTR